MAIRDSLSGGTRRLLVALAAGLLVLVAPATAHAVEGDVRGHAEEECIHILEAGGSIDQCQEAPNPMIPPLNELIWGAIAFTVLFALLAKMGYPAIKKAMDDRTEKIRSDLDAAEQARTEADRVQGEYQAQLAAARTEAARIIEEARQQADQVRRDLTARAEAEATELRQRNAEQVAAERGRVLAEMRGEVATLAIELAEKVVEANLDREANMRLIESYISSVGSRS
jgi:F-type H+-transporting ATPase subunit b